MAATLRWNPKKRIITLLIGGTLTLDEFRQVNELMGEICTRSDFEYAYLVVVLDDVKRPTYSPMDAMKHTEHFREHDIREMVVAGLPGFYRGVAELFRGIIERGVGMPLAFVDTEQDAVARIEGKVASHYARTG